MDHTAFVLAAGLGTRLRPLTLHRPKPLVPVVGVPMLAYALALCAHHGLRKVVVNVHHLPERFAMWQGAHEGVEVTLSRELPDILGTGGGLRHARHLLAERFVVVNADVLSDVDLTALRHAVTEGGASMALRPHEADRYGHVSSDATDTVVRLVQVATATARGPVREDTHFTGLHAMHRDTLALIPEGFACVVRTAYRDLVPRRLVRGLRHEGTWLDVGDPTAYLAANLGVLTTHLPLPLDPFPRAAFATGPRGKVGVAPEGVAIEGCAWVGPQATVGRGTTLRDSVVGARARIAPGARLERVVVWDGCDVPGGHWRDAIFHDGGHLHAPTASP